MLRIQRLAYTVAQTADVAKWKAFAETVLGMATAPSGDGGLFLKMDERDFRIAIVAGAEDRYFASGWEVADAKDFECIALAEMPSPSGCVHMMVEVNSMTEVGLAQDRATQAGVKFMATLGEHENDRMTSFYIMTPGNFALEYGWGGISVDPQTWKTTQTERVSIWGHDFSVGFR